MTRFVVDLGSLKLDDNQKLAVSSAIQSAVLSTLANQKVATNKFAGFIPPDWRGLILREKFADLEHVLEDIVKFAGRP